MFDALRGHFDARELTELTATIAAYNLVSRFLEDLSLEIATPAEARKMLALKGSANVAF